MITKVSKATMKGTLTALVLAAMLGPLLLANASAKPVFRMQINGITAPTRTPPCEPGIKAFSEVGNHTFTVPLGCNTVNATVYGGDSGSADNVAANVGQHQAQDVSVIPDSTLDVFVGGGGALAFDDGWYGKAGGNSRVSAGSTTLASAGGGRQTAKTYLKPDSAYTGATGWVVLRWGEPLPGLPGAPQRVAQAMPDCDAQCEAEMAWMQFFTDHGWAVPSPWTNGFYLLGKAVTRIPNEPYPASVVTGTLHLLNNNLANVDGLSSLTSVGGDLVLGYNDLTNVDGLSSLTSVEGALDLHYNNLTNVDGLSSLSSVGGSLDLTGNNLTNVDGLSSLTSVGGQLYLSDNSLTNVDGLSSLTSVGGWLNLTDSNLTNVDGLSSLTSVGGRLILSGNNLTNVDGLSSLTSVDMGLYLSGNNLTNVNGLSHLASVGGYLSLNSSPALVDLSGLSHLVTFGGSGIRFDLGIQNRPGFVPIQGGALCEPGNAGKYPSGYAQQSDVCAP